MLYYMEGILRLITNHPFNHITVLLIFLFIMLFGCIAHAPVNEEQEAERALNSAFEAEASVYAPDEYAKAKEYFYLAKVKMDKLKFKKARELLSESKKEAQLAIYKAQAYKAIKLASRQLNEFDLSKLEKYVPDSYAIAKKSLKKSEEAFELKKYNLAKQKAELSLQLSSEFSKLLEKKILEEKEKSAEEIEMEKINKRLEEIVEKAKKEAKTIIEEAKREAAAIRARVLEKRFPSSYTVKKGDTLNTIANRREIYNDRYQWPLIYKANRDQIRDPHLIFVGQHLVIPRKITIEELREARKQAGASPPYDPPPEAFHPSDYK